MDQQQDKQIARGLQAGDTDAWRALYDSHAERVWGLVARLMGPVSADVADVVQETFLAAARSARGYDPTRGTLWAWLSGIARRCVALYYRRQKRDNRLSNADGQLDAGRQQIIQWLENRQSEPSDAIVTAEVSSLVRMTLARLPEQHQTVLIARYVDGTAVDQLARQHECSSTAVRSRLARARRAFRRAFTQTSSLSPDAPAGECYES
jgi:RNA polymerase sigma-70 factor (ECF subfamily)